MSFEGKSRADAERKLMKIKIENVDYLDLGALKSYGLNTKMLCDGAWHYVLEEGEKRKMFPCDDLSHKKEFPQK